MLIVKMTVGEADCAFPYDMETEKPHGEIELDLVNKIWNEVAANSGPYPEVKQWKDWVLIDCFNEKIITDQHGDDVIDTATATVEFVDGTSLPVKFQCYY